MNIDHKISIRIIVGICAVLVLAALPACSSSASFQTPDSAAETPTPASSPDSSSEADALEADDVCYGTEFSIEQAWSECVTERDPKAPSTDSIDLSLDLKTFTAGEEATANLLIENINDEPLKLVFRKRLEVDSPFVEVALLADEARVDEVHDPSSPMIGGITGPCADEAKCRTAKVVLAPGGVLSAELEIPTRITRHVYESTDDPSGHTVALAESIDDGPLAAGSYQLRLRFPSWRVRLSERQSRSLEVNFDVELLAE